MNILYQSDDNYSVFMGVSICSLLENNKQIDELNIYILDDQISEVHKSDITGMVEKYGRNVVYIDSKQILSSTNSQEFLKYVGMRKNKHSFLKMFLSEVLPENIGKIIYIDCDTLVVGDLSELDSLDMGECPIGMALDSLVCKAKTSIGFQLDDKYYNSGVIVFEINNWKTQNCEARIVSHVKEHGNYGTVDQDVLNVELKEHIYTLPMKYNVQPIHLVYSIKTYFKNYKMGKSYYSPEEIQKAVEKPKILHFLRYVGESPWHKDNVHPDTPQFDYYLRLSPWSDYIKKPANKGWKFMVEKVMYKVLPKPCFLRIFTWYHERMISNSNKGLRPAMKSQA